MNQWMQVSVLALLICAGCGKGGDESLSKRAGSKVGESLTDFASGVGKGVDQQMAVNAELSKALTDQGITKTIAKSLGIKQGITVYLVAAKPLQGKLMAKAFDKDGQEIGRSIVDVEFAAEDAKYVTFKFDSAMDTQLVEKYAIDVKP